MPPLSKLFPQKRISWVIWVALVVIAFPVYYLEPNYYQRYRKEYRKGWDRCVWGASHCAIPHKDSEFFYTVPKYISNFWAMPLTIRVRRKNAVSAEQVQNKGSKDIVVSLVLSPTVVSEEISTVASDALSIYSDEKGDVEQNTAVLSLPPGGEAITSFLIRANQAKPRKYRIQLYAFGEPVSAPLAFEVEVNRRQVFKLWLIKHFLTPPGANVIIPVGIALLVWIGERGFVLVQKLKRKFLQVFEVASLIRVPNKLRKRNTKVIVDGLLEDIYGEVVIFVLLTIAVVFVCAKYDLLTIWPYLVNQVICFTITSFGMGIILGLIYPPKPSETRSSD
jgi:hypothetical protein